MSVSLLIHWPTGEAEEVPIASLRGADAWAEDAKKLGLELIPHFPDFFPVEHDRLEQLIREVTVFRAAMAERGSAFDQTVEGADRILEAFKRLKVSEGWSASIG